MFGSKTKRLSGILLIGIVIIFSLNSIPVTAQNVDSANFTVQAIIPDNQIDKKQSYFDLLMKPGQSQTLSVTVINNSKDEITVDVSLHAASTNRNGLIEYLVYAEPDETLKVPFDKISKTVSEVKVPAESTKKVDVLITMPSNQFDGTILGGIIFTKRENAGETSGVSIRNQFSYVIAVKLSETDKVISPDFRLKSIEPTLVNYRRSVIASIHNPVELIVKNADVTAHVYKDDSSEPLFSVNKNNIDMAPNSIYPLPIEWEGKNMDPGEYRLTLKLTYQEKIWEWDQKFTISKEESNNINSEALDKTVKKSWWKNWWWIPIVIAGVLLLMWFAFILGRRRKDEYVKESENYS